MAVGPNGKNPPEIEFVKIREIDGLCLSIGTSSLSMHTYYSLSLDVNLIP